MLELERVPSDTNNREKMMHIVCECDTNRSLCGLHLPDEKIFPPDTPAECMVCIDLEPLPCPRCGN